jgi:hypothetical protein
MQVLLIEGLRYVWLGGRDTQGTCQIIKFGCSEVYRKANITEISTNELFSFILDFHERDGGGGGRIIYTLLQSASNMEERCIAWKSGK